MNDQNCGCSQNCGCPGDPKPDMYLMAASPASASTCGTGQPPASNPAAECLIKESTYDVTVGAFQIPNLNNSAPVLICNGALYTIGQWIQFVGDGSTLQITAIVGNQLTLRNGCLNMAAIEGNSTPGTPIIIGTPIIVVGEPLCKSAEEVVNDFESYLATATKLCIPGLTPEPSSTAKMQILGWVFSDTVPNFAKCIHWLSGIWRSASSLFIKPIVMAPSFEETNVNAWRPLVIEKTTGEIREQKNPMESANIGAGKWIPAYDASKMYMVGPAYVFCPIVPVNIYRNNSPATTLVDVGTWPNLSSSPSEYTNNINLISYRPPNPPDAKIYAVIHLNFGVDHNGTGTQKSVTFEINGVERLAVATPGGYSINSCILLIEVDSLTPTFAFKVKNINSGALRYLVSMDLLGFQF